jgi:hypothetical protein
MATIIRALVNLLAILCSAPARANRVLMTGYLRNSALWAKTESSVLKALPANWRKITLTLKNAWAAAMHRRKRLMSTLQGEGRGVQLGRIQSRSAHARLHENAHAKGITNDQMSFILGEYAQRAPELVGGAAELDSEAATTQLREVWKTDAEFKQNIGLAFRAFNSLADERQRRIDEIGNNPMVIRMLAKVGAEMQEDAPAGGDVNLEEQQTIRDLMKSPAYMDPKHADHERVSAKVKAYYQKRYGDQTVA